MLHRHARCMWSDEEATKAFERLKFECTAPNGHAEEQVARCPGGYSSRAARVHDFPANDKALAPAPAIRSRARSDGASANLSHGGGPGSDCRGRAMPMAWSSLAPKAEARWRKRKRSEKLQELIDGIVFVEGANTNRRFNLSPPSTAFGNSFSWHYQMTPLSAQR